MSDESAYVPPSMTNDLRNAIAKSMAENGPDEQPGALESLPTPSVEDVSLKYSGLMNDDTKDALSRRVTALIEQDEDTGLLNQVRYLGKQTKDGDVDAAADFIVSKLNELAASGFIKGALLPLSTYKFGDDFTAVISYVMLSTDGVEFFDENFDDVRVDEGGQISEL